RTLVLCFDGTSNHFSNKNTNVVKLMELLKKTDPSRQMVRYIITQYSLRSTLNPADEGLAWYLYQHVVGDRISIFGFSRGAFTARALAGMVH
ncbi:hypothetical protein BDV93DRAFT_406835, partial [Ceratobasidium sp. AG-I]